MLPPDSKQSEALMEFVRYFRWDTVALLTDNTDYGNIFFTSNIQSVLLKIFSFPVTSFFFGKYVATLCS